MPAESIDEKPSSEAHPSAPARKWLFDRINGTSKYGSSHPPIRVCWVPPCVGCCPSILEENLLCKLWGKLGVIRPDNEKARYWILHVGFLANVIGFFLTMYSCLAISDDYGVLKSASFSSGTLTEVNGITDAAVYLEVGLRAVTLNLQNTFEPSVLTFDEFCDLPSESLKLYLDNSEETCGGCHEVSKSMVYSVVFSTLTFLPSFSTDVLRMYSNYDVNCQKGFSTLFATATLLLSLNTLLKYNRSCFNGFYSGNVPFDARFTVLEEDSTADPDFLVYFDWSMGPGLACLYAGTVLKAVDIVCNLLVPSPNIARDHKEQWDYEMLEGTDPSTDNAASPDEEEEIGEE